MNWYKSIIIVLGCTALQGMERGKEVLSEKRVAPYTSKERLEQAIEKADVPQVKWHLWTMKGKISKGEKEELIKKAQEAIDRCSDATSLAQSSSDRRSFIAYAGISALCGAALYVVVKRCMKKYRSFEDKATLEATKHRAIVEETFVHGTRIPLTPPQLRGHVDEAIRKKTFSPENLKNCEENLKVIYRRAKGDWKHDNQGNYKKECKQYDKRGTAFWGNVGIALLTSSVFWNCCENALDAYECPSARQKTKRAIEIKRELELIDPS